MQLGLSVALIETEGWIHKEWIALHCVMQHHALHITYNYYLLGVGITEVRFTKDFALML